MRAGSGRLAAMAVALAALGADMTPARPRVAQPIIRNRLEKAYRLKANRRRKLALASKRRNRA